MCPLRKIRGKKYPLPCQVSVMGRPASSDIPDFSSHPRQVAERVGSALPRPLPHLSELVQRDPLCQYMTRTSPIRGVRMQTGDWTMTPDPHLVRELVSEQLCYPFPELNGKAQSHRLPTSIYSNKRIKPILYPSLQVINSR